jgi:aryl-alcohol dehydrogenase-like predicted oxidoreductase
VTGLILGTAQFGSGYGITNSVGRLDDGAVTDILAAAALSNIDTFDTAPDYGDAQSRLGSLGERSEARQYVSKFALPVNPTSPANVDAALGDSLAALNAEVLYGLLFHRTADLSDDRCSQAWDSLVQARSAGLVKRIGASIYDADDLVMVAERLPSLDLLQIPANVIDRRLLAHPMLRELHDRGTEIHVRSAYLQGLLLTQPESIPHHLAGLRPAVARLGVTAADHGVTVLELALGFLKDHPLVDAVLVGALSAEELNKTVAAWERADGLSVHMDMPALDERLLDPRSWKASDSS